MYHVRILGKDRQLQAILPDISWSYSRRINEATELIISIPRKVVDEVIAEGHPLYGFFAPTQPFALEFISRMERENKAKYAEIAAFVQVFAGGRLKASGKINRRTLGEVVTVQAYTEEILLESNLTPVQYGKVWDGWDLADVARDLLDGWHTVRVKDQQQWQVYMVDSRNIDVTTEPGTVMLAKRPDGRYYDSGYITLGFSSGEIPKFKQWDRIRWSADSGDVVKTTIQYSTGGVWSEEFDGGLPEEIGLVPNFGSEENVYVRINLYTNDTESEDENGNPVGVTPVAFAAELIARTIGDLGEGNIPVTTGLAVMGISADRASALEVLRDACEQVGWEFNVWNGALNVAESLGVDRTKDFVLRAGTNMEITSLGDEDEELCNVLTAYGPGQGINRMEITVRDEESIAQYGERPAAMEFSVGALSQLQQQAQDYLDAHNSPKTNFQIRAVFDFEHEPDYGLGDQVRVADPETGIVTTTRIMSENGKYDSNGLSVSLDLGKPALNLQAALEGEKPKKPADPLQPSGVYARGVIKGIVIGCSTPKTDWAYTECHVSTASGFTPSNSTLKSTGRQTRFDIMELDPGVRYFAQLIHVDSNGRRSEPSREVSAAAQYVPPEIIPDYSIGVEKFVQNIKPPILVSSLPELPDSRYTVGTTVFLITDKKLYSTDGNTWTLVGAGTVTADEIMAGIISAGGISADYIAAGTITADKYSEIRNVMPYNFLDSLDADNPVEFDFYIPSETTNIVSIKLSARGLRYRAYSVGTVYEALPWEGETGGVVGSMTIATTSANTSVNSGGGITSTGDAGSFSGEVPASHAHPIGGYSGAAANGHTHTYDTVSQFQNLDHKHVLGSDLSHWHEIMYGIFADTTPTGVQVYTDDGMGYGLAYSAGAAPNEVSPYNICSELDLSAKFSGSGWKKIKLTSSRLGRIAANLVVKVDLTA